MDYKFPEKGKRIFVEEGDYYEIAHIQAWDRGIQFWGYIRGYKYSADLIVKNALESKDIGILDTCVYPVIFLYRQYIELMVKYIYIEYSTKEVNSINDVGHDIKEIWKRDKEIVLNRVNGFVEEVLDAIGDYIDQFHIKDQNSFNFRFPITKNLNLIQKEEQRINLKYLLECMNELQNGFEYIEYMLSKSII